MAVKIVKTTFQRLKVNLITKFNNSSVVQDGHYYTEKDNGVKSWFINNSGYGSP